MDYDRPYLYGSIGYNNSFLEDTTGNTAQDDELGELFAGIMALLIGLPIVIFW